MDRNERMQYQKCKHIIKNWEVEFKKKNGSHPNKVDMKSAPKRVKDAYGTYWKLKSMMLECSFLLDATIDENAQDSFNILDCSAPIDSKTVPNLNDDSQVFKPLLESTFDMGSNISVCSNHLSQSGKILTEHDLNTSNINENSKLSLSQSTTEKNDLNSRGEISPRDSLESQSLSCKGSPDQVSCQTFSELSLSQELTVNANSEEDSQAREQSTVWGPHVSNENKAGTRKLQQKSVSFHYAEKLFAGSKFSKRNPRKPCNFKRSKTCNSLPTSETTETSTIPSTSTAVKVVEEPSEKCVQVNQVEEVQNYSVSSEIEKEINEKDKVVVVSKTALVKYHGVSLVDSVLRGEQTMAGRKVDAGWLARVCQSDLDSGIDSSKSKSLDSGPESDDDIVYNSDSESTSRFSFMLPKSVSEPTKATPESIKSVVVEPTKPVAMKEFSTTLTVLPETDLCKSDDGKIEAPSILPALTVQGFPVKEPASLLPPITIPESLPKRPLNAPPLATTSVSNPCKRSLDSSTQSTSKKPRLDGQSKPGPAARTRQTVQEKKMAELERKVRSGKANQCFVKVDIKKKVFVKGKRGFNYSTYKKKKWKASQSADTDGLNSGILKCFKCGDVGHFARQCKSVSDLLPYEEDIDEESLFPTLAEAEEIAKEAEKSIRVQKAKPAITRDVPLPPSKRQPEEEIDLPEECNIPPPEERQTDRVVEPLFQLNPDGSLPGAPDMVMEALRALGHKSFLTGQEEAIMSVLCGESTLLSVMTGGGKSLCYLLPAYLYHKHRQPAITLVVSPLVSLMEDQVSCCGGLVSIACLHHGQTEKQRQAVLSRLEAGELAVLLVAPEAIARDSSASLLSRLPPVAFACIDEAHCLSHWSHNFRPSYLTLCKVLRENMRVHTLLGLTATATVSTLSEVRWALGASRLVSSSSPLPDHLLLTVSSDRDRDRALVQLLQGERFSTAGSVIVYCTRRQECDRLAAFLRTNLQDLDKPAKRNALSSIVEVYHAGLTTARRRRVQNAFMSDKVRIIVATVAFGMGINKNDIGGIIHYNMPSSFENYVQEVGRAGRDGNVAHCHLFLDSKGGDLSEVKRHLYANGVDRGCLRRLVEGALTATGCPVGGPCPRHETALPTEPTITMLDLPEESVATLLSYLESAGVARLSLLPMAYTSCTVTSYKGPRHLASLASKCAPLAVGIATAKSAGAKVQASVKFDVMKVAAKLHWDSGIVKRILKQLEWDKSDEGKWSKSGVSVQLGEVGFRVLSPCDLSPDERDAALDALHCSVTRHEQNGLKQLHHLHNCLSSVAYKTVNECGDSVDVRRSEKLLELIKNYFKSENILQSVVIDKAGEMDEEEVGGDIRRLISAHPGVGLTGRAVARILHGISSPNFPAVCWAKSPFWRLHLDKDFHSLCHLATKQIIYMR